MAVSESDVSILIPSYRRPEMTLRALQSACQTGAGEIIVSDDASGDGTVEAIRTVRDDRLQVVIQPRNLGLWKNHLALLKMASRPWIKFIQNDDRIEPGGLATLVSHADDKTTLVGALGIYENSVTGEKRSMFSLAAPRRWTSDEYMVHALRVNNELGTPSDVLYRRETMDFSDDTWQNDRSMDLVCNILAASRGEVVLLPPGPIVTLDHPGRDSHVAGLDLWFKRLISSLRFFHAQPDPRIRRFARVLGVSEAIGSTTMLLGLLRRGKFSQVTYPVYFARVMMMSGSLSLLRDLPMVYHQLVRRYRPWGSPIAP
jgi:glycosyltransferase involved in cell wall biosynthesis